MPKPPSFFIFNQSCFTNLPWFMVPNVSKVSLLTSSAKCSGVSRTLQTNISLDRAKVLTIFILPCNEMSL